MFDMLTPKKIFKTNVPSNINMILLCLLFIGNHTSFLPVFCLYLTSWHPLSGHAQYVYLYMMERETEN